MPDEPKKDQPEDIAGILSDLESVLGGSAPSAPSAPSGVAAGSTTDAGAKSAPPPAPAPANQPPAPASNTPEPPKLAAPPPPPPPASEPPKPAPAAPPKIELGATPPPAPAAPKPPPPAAAPPSIELAPRAGMIPPASKAAEPVKPPEPAKPPESAKAAEPVKPPPPPPPPPPAAKPAAPAPAAAPAGGAAPPPAASDEIPEGVTKDHIRRVAYIHTAEHAEAKAALAAFLGQAGRTISKKPLYLREVLSMEALEPALALERVKKAKAVVVLAVVEGWPKAEQLGDAFESAGIQYHAIAPGDVQKKSMAVDIIVDMMLLPGEG